MFVKSSLICQVLFLALLLGCVVAPAATAQKSSMRQKTRQTKRKSAAQKKVPTSRTAIVIELADNRDAVCDDFYQSYNSTEGNFDVCLPNPPQNKKLVDFLKTSSDVLQTPLGEVASTQLTLDTRTNTYIIVWYDLPEVVAGAEKMREILEAINFKNLKLTNADVFGAEKQKLGKWFERPFGCVDAPRNVFSVCIKERFFISGKRLYRVAAMSQSSTNKIPKTIVESGFNRFLDSFRVFNLTAN